MKLSHVLLLASNINEMSQFFIQSLGLKKGDRPPFKFDGAWLYDQDNIACIHISNRYSHNSEQSKYLGRPGTSDNPPSQATVDHLAFVSEDYIGTKDRLVNNKINFIERKIPEEKGCQIFINGPDGIVIEIFFSINKDH